MTHPYMRSRMRTGRTTRMMAHAFHLASQDFDKKVYIVVFNGDHARGLSREYNISPATTNRIVFLISGDDRIDWDRMMLRLPEGSYWLLIDHAVIESRYGRVITSLFEWDDEDTLKGMRTEQERGKLPEPIRRFQRRKLR